MLTILSEQHSLLGQFIAELRDVSLQKDRMRFRRNVERVGEIMAYELSKTLPWTEKEVITPLGTKSTPVLAEQPVLATVLRAGLPLHQGLLNYFDQADNAFISAYRHYTGDNTFEINVEYLASPSLDDRIVILTDPMLATGKSAFLAAQAMRKNGTPKELHLVHLIASQQGLDYMVAHFPDAKIWVGTVDPELDAHSYIVPGLGDAGDLSFGEKL